jgi:hypothetical protein
MKPRSFGQPVPDRRVFVCRVVIAHHVNVQVCGHGLVDLGQEFQSLNPSSRWGLSPNAFQIRPTVDFDSPDFSAIVDRDQCVAFFGVDSKVSTMTFSTWSTLIVAGRPGRGSSTSPSSLCSRNRLRHLRTVGRDTPVREATAVFDAPVAHSRTIRERKARSCADFRRRTHRSNCSRSSADSVSSARLGPRCDILHHINN